MGGQFLKIPHLKENILSKAKLLEHEVSSIILRPETQFLEAYSSNQVVYPFAHIDMIKTSVCIHSLVSCNK